MATESFRVAFRFCSFYFGTGALLKMLDCWPRIGHVDRGEIMDAENATRGAIARWKVRRRLMCFQI